MLQIILHSSHEWKQQIHSEGGCVLSISFKVFWEKQFRSKRNTMSSNSFRRKVLNLCHSIQQNWKWLMTKKIFFFFLMFPQWIQQFWKALLKLRDKWFCVFLLLIWFKNKLTAFFFFLFLCKILLFYDQ